MQNIKQFVLSPATGKRIIAMSLLHAPGIVDALLNRTIVIIAGTTNGYVAEECLKHIGETSTFQKRRFFRGVTLPPWFKTTDAGRLSDESQFPGDVVITKGRWEQGKTIFDVADGLQKGDVIIKGANAVNLEDMEAAVLIGHPTAGTIIPTLQSVLGRRVELYIPVGLEKRVPGKIHRLAEMLNSPQASGLRYLPVSGRIVTELQAIQTISGAKAELIAGGGVGGAEGSCWIAVSGTEEQLKIATELLNAAGHEQNFEL